MASEQRLINVDADNISIPDDREFDQESLSELDLVDLSDPGTSGSSSRAAQSAKALEIAEERSLPPSVPASPLPWDNSFAARAAWASESSAAAPDTSIAPPDYLAAIASGSVREPTESDWTERMPQSMSDAGLLSQDQVERGAAYESPERDLAKELGVVGGQIWRILTQYVRSVQKTRGRRFGLTRRVVRWIIVAIVLIILLSVFLPIIIRAIVEHVQEEKWERQAHPFRNHPAYKRDGHQDHPDTDHCTFTSFSKFSEYSKDYDREHEYRFGYGGGQGADELRFQLIDEVGLDLPPEFTHPIVSGKVEVISVPHANYWSRKEVEIRSYTATNRPWQVERAHIAWDDDGFTLRTPTLKKGPQQSETSTTSCLSVWVGIYIPVDLEIDSWTTLLRSLSFVDQRSYVFDSEVIIPEAQQVPMGAIKILNDTVIKSNQGSIDISYWNSKQTVLETRKGNVRGKYAFYDLLDIKTLGGEVNIQVDPRGVALATRGKSSPLKFSTSAGSGKTTVNVLSPSTQDWTPHFMESVHRTSSGAMQLQYPSDWAGVIEGITTAEHVEITGQNVHKNEDSIDTAGEIHMMKGNRVSDFAGTLGRIDLESESGSIDLVIGAV